MYSFAAFMAAMALAMPSTLVVNAASTQNFLITSGCSQFPAFSPGSDTTGIFNLQFVQSKAPVNNQSLTSFSYYDSDKGRFVVAATTDLAKIPIRCNQTNAAANGGVPIFETLIDNGNFVPLQIFAPAVGFNPNANNAQLVYGAASGVSQLARPFGHDASASDGIFLGGADNSTRFATEVEFVPSNGDVHRTFYSLRYVPTGGRPLNAEFSGFLKVKAI